MPWQRPHRSCRYGVTSADTVCRDAVADRRLLVTCHPKSYFSIGRRLGRAELSRSGCDGVSLCLVSQKVLLLQAAVILINNILMELQEVEEDLNDKT